MNHDNVKSLDFSSSFELEITRNGSINGICGWFDILFDTPDDSECETVEFSTSPTTKPTHWKQTMFLFKNEIKVLKGMKLNGTINCAKSTENPRDLVIAIKCKVVTCDGVELNDSEVIYDYFIR